MAEVLPPTSNRQPLRHTDMRPSWEGGKVTDTEARQLVSKLQNWVGQFNHPQARELAADLDDIERCFVRVWTEIDEALTRLMLMKADPASADEHLRIALSYLHRWQDRGGRIGNVDSQ
jgi:hypothetical protein